MKRKLFQTLPFLLIIASNVSQEVRAEKSTNLLRNWAPHYFTCTCSFVNYQNQQGKPWKDL